MLGSAQWGWNTTREEAFRLLDAWLETGRREIDCATNYPINRNPADFRAAENILAEYIGAHGLHDLRITMKIGSLDNMRTPDVNLSPSFILMMAEEYLRIFGGNLDCLMLHWDNREEIADIRASLETLAGLQQAANIRPGLSGVRRPDLYATASEGMEVSFDIQLKHNVLQSDFERYAPLRGNPAGTHRFFAYGINAGGVKLDAQYAPDSVFLARGGQPETLAARLETLRAALPDWNTAFVRPPLKTMNQVGLVFAGFHPGLQGILLGVSSVAQLAQTLDFYRNFDVFDYTDVWQALNKIAR